MLNYEMTQIVEAIAPELLLAGVALIGVLIGAILKDGFNGISFKFGAVTLFAAAVLAVIYREGGSAFGGLVETNTFLNYAKVIAFTTGGAALLMAEGFLTRHKTIRYEYALLTLFAALGIGMILSAADLMTLYMGIETLSLSSYVLAAFHRDNLRSSEAGLKYFVLGALASGILLYGSSLVYGFAGSTRFVEIANAEMNMGVMLGLVLMITGLAFKVSAAPMHVWTPDVYEGSPSPVVAFFATAPKIASMVVFANVLFVAFGVPEAIQQWQVIVSIIAGASMLIGAIGALVQTNLKRLLGYSSIANMGYALVAVAAGYEYGGAALLVFMTLYVVASLGLFGGVLVMRRRGGMVEHIDELSGMVKFHPWIAVSLAVLVFSVAGLPPLGGFFGKWMVVEAALKAELLPLVILLIFASVISLGYYLRLIWIMFVNEPREAFQRVDSIVVTIIVFTALACAIGFTVFFGHFQETALRAVVF